ncbi:MAG: hypothetical protein OXH49_11385 [Gemmatimonadetes bacterium]|nr:hypothetical protein [Gemmatimonadota bacterium]
MSNRPAVAVRRHGRQVLVVADFDGDPGADAVLEGLPDGDWADAGGPAELVIGMELLERLASAAPDPIAGVAATCVAALIAAVEVAEDGRPDPRMN